jgi:tRNA(Ile)-lysidine synthase
MKSRSRQKNQLIHCLDSIPANNNTCVLAFSGGLDSCVLLHLLANSSPLRKTKLWHVHHGLQAEADAMAFFCQQQADVYGFDLKTSHLNLQTTESNIEAIARTARYELFAKGLTDNDRLLTAHHADDQAETFFLNVFRGTGSAGLRGIAVQKKIANATLIRPMLRFTRQVLLDYARQYDLNWFEDPSNNAYRFDRNYLRHNVMPPIEKRWPNYQNSISTVCEIQVETQKMLEDLGQIDYDSIVHSDNKATPGLSDSLEVDSLKSLSLARQKNVIRYWLGMNSRASLPKTRLETFIKQLTTKQGANPMIENGEYAIRIYDGRVFIVDQQSVQPKKSMYDDLSRSRLEIPELDLILDRQSVLDYLKVEDSGQTIQIRFRQDGDSESDHKHGHRLKRLFQKFKIAPWLRNQTPQLLLNGELLGLWVKP